MRNLGMELYSIEPLRTISDGRSETVLGACNCLETFWQILGVVAVTHPRYCLSVEALKKIRGVLDLKFGLSILAAVCCLYASAQSLNHELQTVADAENRHAEMEDL